MRKEACIGLLALLVLCATPVLAGTLTGNCTTRAGGCLAGEVGVLRLADADNSHAELNGWTNFTYDLCCPGTNLGALCTGDPGSDVIVRLETPSNAHVEDKTGAYFANEACLQSTDYAGGNPVSCYTTRQECNATSDAYCVLGITGPTNAHVQDCAVRTYTRNVCCVAECTVGETPEESCFDGADNDCDGFGDCQDPDCENKQLWETRTTYNNKSYRVNASTAGRLLTLNNTNCSQFSQGVPWATFTGDYGEHYDLEYYTSISECGPNGNPSTPWSVQHCRIDIIRRSDGALIDRIDTQDGRKEPCTDPDFIQESDWQHEGRGGGWWSFSEQVDQCGCPGVAEVCDDGIDNDCDGFADCEDLTGIGSNCTSINGKCNNLKPATAPSPAQWSAPDNVTGTANATWNGFSVAFNAIPGTQYTAQNWTIGALCPCEPRTETCTYRNSTYFRVTDDTGATVALTFVQQGLCGLVALPDERATDVASDWEWCDASGACPFCTDEDIDGVDREGNSCSFRDCDDTDAGKTTTQFCLDPFDGCKMAPECIGNCTTYYEDTSVRCNDVIDNDCDGLINCLDPDCAPFFPVPSVKKQNLSEVFFHAPGNITKLVNVSHANLWNPIQFMPEAYVRYKTIENITYGDSPTHCGIFYRCFGPLTAQHPACGYLEMHEIQVRRVNDNKLVAARIAFGPWGSCNECGTYDQCVGIGTCTCGGPPADTSADEPTDWHWRENDGDPCAGGCGPDEAGAGECTDYIDNDCDGLRDYDGWNTEYYVSPGDESCPVGVTGINLTRNYACMTDGFLLQCNSTVADVRSIEANITLAGSPEVRAGNCTFLRWDGITAEFDCETSVVGLVDVTCVVNNSKSFPEPAPNDRRTEQIDSYAFAVEQDNLCFDTIDNDCNDAADCTDLNCLGESMTSSGNCPPWGPGPDVGASWFAPPGANWVNATCSDPDCYSTFALNFTVTPGLQYDASIENSSWDYDNDRCAPFPSPEGAELLDSRYRVDQPAGTLLKRTEPVKTGAVCCDSDSAAGRCGPGTTPVNSEWCWEDRIYCGACDDTDGDGHGVLDTSTCLNPEPDCDDTDPNNFPRNLEDCSDGQDNDCDGFIDEEDRNCLLLLNLTPNSYYYNVSPWMNITLDTDGDAIFTSANHTYICDYTGCNSTGECACGATATGCGGEPLRDYFCDLAPGVTECRFRDRSLNKSGIYDYTFCYVNNTGADTLWTTPYHCSLNATAHDYNGGAGPGDDRAGTNASAGYLHRYYRNGTGGWDEPVNCSSQINQSYCTIDDDVWLNETVAWNTCWGHAGRPGEPQLDNNRTAYCGWNQSWELHRTLECNAATDCTYAPSYCDDHRAWRCMMDPTTNKYNWTDVGYVNRTLVDSAVWNVTRNASGLANVTRTPTNPAPADWFCGGDEPLLVFTADGPAVYTANFTHTTRACPTDPARDKEWCRYEVRDNGTGTVVAYAEAYTTPRECPGGLAPAVSTNVSVRSNWSWTEINDSFPAETACFDGADNDCDQLTDLDDPDCRQTVSGYVFERDNVTPIEDTIVKLVYPPGGNTTSTDATGAYMMAWIPPGTFTMDAQKPGYRSNTTLITFNPGDVLEQNFTLTNGTCDRCLNFEGRCDTACAGKDQCTDYHTNVPGVCQGKRPGTWVSYNESDYVLCCGEEEFKAKTASSFTAQGCMDDLVPYTRIVRYLGKPVRVVFYVWEPCS